MSMSKDNEWRQLNWKDTGRWPCRVQEKCEAREERLVQQLEEMKERLKEMDSWLQRAESVGEREVDDLSVCSEATDPGAARTRVTFRRSPAVVSEVLFH